VSDRDDLEAQIGRSLRAASDVVARCPLGLPVVARVPPILDDGTPFPTRYWLACPLAVTRVGRLEGAGGVRAMDRHAAADAAFRARLDRAHARYAAERDGLVPEGARPSPGGGVAGSRGGVKCLHAHYADHAAGNDNPVGALVAPWVEPLDCTIPCVVDGRRNPTWREPR
jgi:uncharacterized protein